MSPLKGFRLSPQHASNSIEIGAVLLFRVYFDFYDKNFNLITQIEGDKYSLCDKYLRDYYDIEQLEASRNVSTVNNRSDFDLASQIENYSGLLSQVRVDFLFLKPGSSFKNPLCPLVFKRAQMRHFYVHYITDTWISRNVLRFSKLNGVYFKNKRIAFESNMIYVYFQSIYNIFFDNSS